MAEIAYTILVLLILFFLSRNILVRFVFNKKCSTIENRYGLVIKADKVGVSGLSTVYIENLLVKPKDKDTLFCMRKADVKFSLSDLVFAKVNPLEVEGWIRRKK